MAFPTRGESESANDEVTLLLDLLPGEERGAQAGAVLQGHLRLLRPVAAHLQPLVVQRPHQVFAHLLPVGVFTGTRLQLPGCPLQRPQDPGRPHLLGSGRRLPHLARAGLLRSW